MNAFQKILDGIIEAQMKPEEWYSHILLRKMCDLGLDVPDGFKSMLIDQLLSDEINITIPDDMLKEIGVSEDQLQGIFDSLGDSDLDGALSDWSQQISEKIPEAIESISNELLKNLHIACEDMIKDQVKTESKFERMIWRKWHSSLRRLKMLIVISQEVGSAFNKEHRPKAAEANDFRFEVLTRLHARACQVSCEIFQLLRGGFADGAHARWRTLHEIAVIACFIYQEESGVAEKFLQHEHVENYRSAKLYHEYSKRLKNIPYPADELAELKSLHDAVVAAYGNDFKYDYGWATERFGAKRVTFKDIEESVKLDHLRPFNRAASDNVHSGPRGARWRLGVPPGEDILLSGPSSSGFTYPVHQCAISMLQVGACLLNLNINLDCAVFLKTMSLLVDEIGRDLEKVELGNLHHAGGESVAG